MSLWQKSDHWRNQGYGLVPSASRGRHRVGVVKIVMFYPIVTNNGRPPPPNPLPPWGGGKDGRGLRGRLPGPLPPWGGGKDALTGLTGLLQDPQIFGEKNLTNYPMEAFNLAGRFTGEPPCWRE
jgi:hypothetical protein